MTWLEFLEEHEKAINKYFNPGEDEKPDKRNTNKIVRAARKEFGYADKADSYILKKLLHEWQKYKGV